MTVANIFYTQYNKWSKRRVPQNPLIENQLMNKLKPYSIVDPFLSCWLSPLIEKMVLESFNQNERKISQSWQRRFRVGRFQDPQLVLEWVWNVDRWNISHYKWGETLVALRARQRIHINLGIYFYYSSSCSISPLNMRHIKIKSVFFFRHLDEFVDQVSCWWVRVVLSWPNPCN